MKVFIATVGSRGDVQPYVALGRGLRARGHTVTLCTSKFFESFVTEHGLIYAYMNNDLVELLESDEGREAIENMTTPWGIFKTARKLLKQLAPTGRALLREGWEAARESDPDLVVCHPKAFGCVHYAEKLGVPVILAYPFPQLVPTREFPSIGFPEWKLGSWYHKLTYSVVRNLGRAFGKKYIKEWRDSQQMPPQPRGTSLLHTSAGDRIPVMHGFSRHVVPRPADWPDSAVVTGYWFLDREKAWRPSVELERFLAAAAIEVERGPAAIDLDSNMSGFRTDPRADFVLHPGHGGRGNLAVLWKGALPLESPDRRP